MEETTDIDDLADLRDQLSAIDKAGDAFALQTALWTGAVMVGVYFGDLLVVLLCGIGWVVSVIRLNLAGWGIGDINNG